MKKNKYGVIPCLILALTACFIDHSSAWADDLNARQIQSGSGEEAREKRATSKADKPPEETRSAPIRIQVSAWRITGNSVFTSETLLKILEPSLGEKSTLEQLQTQVDRITAFYRDQGYLLATAYLPEQNMTDSGEIVVHVVEAVWGAIAINNQSQISDDVIAMHVSEVKTGTVVHRDTVETAAIYLSELPGTHAQMTVQPGQSFGLSDLNIEVKAAQSMAGAFIFDNAGNPYTGRNRLGLNQQFFNPLGRGDAVSIHVLTSGENLTSGRIAYETVWGRPALSLGLAASKFDYQLGDSARSLMAGGSAQQASAWVQYYFFRRLQVNVKGRLQLDSFALNDRIEVTDTTTAKRISAYSLELLGDRADAGPGQSSNTWVLGLHGGTTAFENASAAFADSSSAHIAGDYGFVTLKMQLEQFLSPRMSWYAAFSGQWANTNLDGSQKFALGGPHSVRAYESGVLNGDSGQLWTLEWRYKPAMPTGWSAENLVQARVFWDYGQVKVNQKPWSNAENAFAISGLGWGFDWQFREGWRASINMAWADANIPTILANANASRLGAWFELRRAY